MKKQIAVIRGDGIGPEIIDEAIKVLNKVSEVFNHEFEYSFACVGGEAIDKFGEPLPQAELQKCLNSDSVLLGAVGGNKWNDVPSDLRPEKALLKLRQAML